MKRNTAVVGVGYWGRNLARNFAELGALRVVCDSSEENLRDAEKRYDVAAEPDFERVLIDEGTEAVVLATPAETHYRLGLKVLDAGRHLYVEKPLALVEEHARELVEKAQEKGLVLMVGHILHYHPAVVKMKELVDDGRIGRLQAVYSNRMSLGKIRREENILWSFAPHDISLIRSLVHEEPSRIYSSGGYFLSEKIADTTISVFEYSSGVRAHIYVSWLHPFKEQRLVVVGSEKMIVFDDTREKDKLLLYPHDIDWKEGRPVPAKREAQPVSFGSEEPLRAACRGFLEAVQGGAPPLTDGPEGLATLRILAACQRSMEKGEVVELEGAGDAGGRFIHPTAFAENLSAIGRGTKVWHFCHLMGGGRIGEDCSLGQNVFVGAGVTIGSRVKIQNNVSVYSGVEIEDDVFLGPSMVFTNVNTPRSEVSRKGEYRRTVVKKGATVGANATIVCGEGITVGEYSFVGAGAVVTRDVKPYSLVVGNPALHAGWRCRCGLALRFDGPEAACGGCGSRYEIAEGEAVRPLE